MESKKFNRLLHHHETYLFIITLAIFAFFSIKTGGVFISGDNIQDLVAGVVMDGIIAAGVLVVLISGGIDISFMAVACVAQYVTSYFLINVEAANLFFAILVSAAVGIALGVLNGLFVCLLKVPAIIITIATMNIYFGLLIWIGQGKLLNHFPKWFATKTEFTIGMMPLLILLIVFVITAWILNRTRLGRRIYAIGGNPAAAKRVNISVLKTQLFAYGYLGFLAAMGGLMQMYLSQTVAPNTLVGSEMNVLAMVVLGGAALLGGRGTATGTLIGVLLIGAIGNGMVLIGISSYWFDFVTGMVVLLSFCITGYIAKRKKSKEGIR